MASSAFVCFFGFLQSKHKNCQSDAGEHPANLVSPSTDDPSVQYALVLWLRNRHTADFVLLSHDLLCPFRVLR